jgi:hypothetical protein
VRTLAKIVLDTTAANAAIQNNSLGAMIQKSMEAARPEAAYFGISEGKRTAYIVFDMKEPSDMVAMFEPWFNGAGASVELTPLMNADDLKSGLGRFAASR